jgi:hypothetical protein
VRGSKNDHREVLLLGGAAGGADLNPRAATFVAGPGVPRNSGSAAVGCLVKQLVVAVTVVRVLYAHALVAAPRLALGRFAALGRLLGDPRLGMSGAFLSLSRVLPLRYPLAQDVESYLAEEQRLGWMLDYAVIAPRLQPVYEWSAEELREPGLLKLVRDGKPIYAWPFEQRHVWNSAGMPLAGRVLERATRPR